MQILTNEETIKAIKEITSEIEDQPTNIRLYVQGFSWSGPSFGLALDEQKDEDLAYVQDDVTFLMEEALYDQFGDIKVESMGGGFMVMPVSQDAGGCGTCGGCG